MGRRLALGATFAICLVGCSDMVTPIAERSDPRRLKQQTTSVVTQHVEPVDRDIVVYERDGPALLPIDFTTDCTPVGFVLDYRLSGDSQRNLRMLPFDNIEQAIGIVEVDGFAVGYPHPPIAQWLVFDAEPGRIGEQRTRVAGYDGHGQPTINLYIAHNELGYGLSSFTWCKPNT